MLAAMPTAPDQPIRPNPAPPRDRDDACPGALRLHAADDGALARVRIPGGVLTAAQAQALGAAAARLGDGEIHLTSRGNAQLRGLGAACGAELGQLLGAAGLLPSAAHERVRNIVASPLSGLDGLGHLDIRPWLRELDALLCASAPASALSGRFLFALDDGRGDVAALAPDIALRAAPHGRARLTLGRTAPLLIPAAAAPRAALLAAELFLAAAATAAASTPGAPAPHWRITDLPDGGTSLIPELAVRLGRLGIPVLTPDAPDAPDNSLARTGTSAGPGEPALNALGSRPAHLGDVAPAGRGVDAGAPDGESFGVGWAGDSGGSGAHFGDVRPAGPLSDRLGPAAASLSAGGNVGGRDGQLPAVSRRRGSLGGGPALGVIANSLAPQGERALSVLAPLGRLTADQWRAVTEVAERGANGEVRLTPWRGVVVAGVDAACAREELAALDAAGLVTDAGSPWVAIGACVGRPGCAKSLADVRADAAATLRPDPAGQAAGAAALHLDDGRRPPSDVLPGAAAASRADDVTSPVDVTPAAAVAIRSGDGNLPADVPPGAGVAPGPGDGNSPADVPPGAAAAPRADGAGVLTGVTSAAAAALRPADGNHLADVPPDVAAARADGADVTPGDRGALHPDGRAPRSEGHPGGTQSESLPVYWAGCARGCGRPRGDRVDVVATAQGYRVDVVRGGAVRTSTTPRPPDLAATVAAARSGAVSR
jgi:precorrin-3B synthase